MGDFLAYELLPIILNMTLTASVVIVLVLLARLALRRAPRVCSYALWLVVLFRLLCPVSVTAGFSLMGLLDTPVTEVTAHTSAAAYVPRDVVYSPEPTVTLPVPGVGEVVTETLPQGEEQMVADPLEAPMAIATILWMTGAAAMVIYGMVSLVRLHRRLVGAVPLEKNVYLADHIDTPFVLGLVRPKIYLPSALPEGERDYILLHERHHIRRLDHVVKLMAFLALCIHWFNPLVWLMFILLGRDMEMSCDEAVMRKLGEAVRADYSASLLRLATGRKIIAGAPLAFGEGDTRDRVVNVLRWKEPKLWLVILSVAVVVVLVVVCGTNADSKSTVNTKAVGNGVEVTMTLKTPVRSYAVYQEIYQDGRLISGKPILLDGFQEDDWEEMPHRSTFTLRAQSSVLPTGGFSGEVTTRCEENGATEERTDQLPGTQYTGMGSVVGSGTLQVAQSQATYSLDAGDSVVLYSVLFSQETDGAICVYHDGWSLAKVNDAVIQYRLAISSETAEIYQDLPLDLAQTLYDLRVETLRDPEDYGAQGALRTLLDAMGASACGDYELQYYDLSEEPQFLTAMHTGAYWPGGIHSFPPYAKTGVVIWYDAVTDEAAFRTMQNAVPDLMLALVPELSEVNIGCAGPDGTAGYAGSSVENDAYLRESLGYESFAEVGSSASSIRALMELLEWPESDSGEETESPVPSEEEVLQARAEVLEGMTERQAERLTETVKVANLALESQYLYHNLFGELSDPNSLYWNYFDETGEIQIGWAYSGETNMETVCRQEDLTEEEFYAKYGTPVVVENRYDADDFITLIEELKEPVQNETLKTDLQEIMDLTELAKNTHVMEYVNSMYKKIHDLDYFLLRYGPTDVGPYVEDDSTITKYYGTLSIYQ